MMQALIGLGNPGAQYAQTKHNAGYWVVDELVRRWKRSFKAGQGDYVYAEIPKPRLVAAKPTPGMNASGSAVKAIVDRWNVDLPEMLVIVDDVDLPLGTLRIRPHGGDGCHRGMESVIYHLKDNRFPRLRFGIATDEDLRPAENYVLKPFRKQDRRLAEEMVSTAADAVETIVYQGLNKAMNLFNRTNKTMENYS